MTYTSPKYGITGPSATTEFRKLGAELQAMLLSIDTILGSFDYKGADPSTVLARVVALETLASRQAAFSGTASERAAAAAGARYGTLWTDTDGAKHQWLSDGAGKWRQASGMHSFGAAAWSNQTAPFYGRTANATLPTFILPNETIAVSSVSVGSGFGETVLRGVSGRGVDTTDINVGLHQFASNIQQAYAISWRIVIL